MKTIMVSGGFDPIHVGHLDLLKDAAVYGKVIVALNSDDWLIRKKGYTFMPWDDRREILESINYVDSVVGVDDKDDTVCEAIKEYRPNIFGNGGDRIETNTPESELCASLGIIRLFRLGGEVKRASSSELTAQQRPWGHWQLFMQANGYWVKSLTINPKQSISLQKHSHRSEIWVIASGVIMAEIDNNTHEVWAGESIKVNAESVHRLTNLKDTPAVVIEIALGKKLSETDIERLEDNYGRVLK